MNMPFGPHQGEQLTELSTHYLRWITSDVSQADWPELVEAAKEELKFRENFQRDSAVTL